MNYQTQFSNNEKLSQSKITNNQPINSQQNIRTQRSNSGKKLIVIRRKSNNSIMVNSQGENNINNGNSISSEIRTKSQYSDKNSINNNILSSNKPLNATVITNNSQTHIPSSYHLQTSSHIPSNQQKNQPQNSMQISRGQFYEDQLNSIQKQVQFFRYQLQEKQKLNNLLVKQIREQQNSFLEFVKFVHGEIDNVAGWKEAKQRNYPSLSSSTRYSYAQSNKQSISGPSNLSTRTNHLQNQIVLLIKHINSIFQTQNHFQQIIKSQQITLKQFQQKINDLIKQNLYIKKENKKLQDINEINKNMLEVKEKMIQLDHVAAMGKRNQKGQKNQKTAQNSRQENNDYRNTFFVNVEIQTDQKRIGSAASVHKYNSYRFNQDGSPYKNYLVSPNYRRGSIYSKSSKDSNQNTQLAKNYQNPTGRNSPKKVNLQSIKQKRLNQKNSKLQPKKKTNPNIGYVNHLIQSQTLIKDSQNNSSIRENNTLFNNTTDSTILLSDSKNINTKSQLSIRRPIHRSRSHSQQQISNSKQRTISNKSINNIASRVSSAYSLNPVNKFGQKRLCNQLNSRKIRKITQLSQQSQDIEQKMRLLMQQQQMLKQKFKQVEKIKVSRQKSNKNSRQKSKKNSRVLI